MLDIVPLPPDYADWLTELKTRIHNAQQRAALAVNRELVLLYWQIGRDILARQAQQGWDAKVIERVAQDFRAAFLDMKGFSRAKLMSMRAFAEAWPDAAIVQQAVGQLPIFWASAKRQVAQGESQILITTHDPMMVGSLRREQVHILRHEGNRTAVDIPSLGQAQTLAVSAFRGKVLVYRSAGYRLASGR